MVQAVRPSPFSLLFSNGTNSSLVYRFWSGRPAGVNLPKEIPDSLAPGTPVVDEQQEEEDDLSVPAVPTVVDDSADVDYDDEEDDDEFEEEAVVLKPVPKPVFKPKAAALPAARKGLAGKQRQGIP